MRCPLNSKDFLLFLQQSPTAFHAAKEITSRLAFHDFEPLEEDNFSIKLGKRYFLEKNGCVIAFKLPKQSIKQAKILGSHTDSPCLKLKPYGKTSTNMVTHGVEVYGGPYLSTWMSRDLVIAGQVFYIDESDQIQSSLIHLEEAPLIIPNVAIHLDRKVNEEGHKIEKQKHLAPLLGLCEQEVNSLDYIHSLIEKNLSYKSLLSSDLFLVPIESPRFLGEKQELLASYRIDNLAGVYGALSSLLASQETEHTLQCAIFWNHEEIGSGTDEGALSPLFGDFFDQICGQFSLNKLKLKQNSLCISIDSAHAFHPNYGEKYDEEHHCLLGKGVAIKYNANMRYATTAKSLSKLKYVAQTCQIPLQAFVSRSDMPCGSTIGPLFAQTTGIETIDIGIAQLAMHSAREVMAIEDQYHLHELLKGILHHES